MHDLNGHHGTQSTDAQGIYAQPALEVLGMDSGETYRPIIGIPVLVQHSPHGPHLFADAMSAWAIERMHGRVFLLPLWPFPTHKHLYQSLWPLMQSMDGLLLPALPQDMNWSLQWQEHKHHPGPQTWPIAWQIALAQLATVLGMPVLAVAEGAEQWNVALGGTLAAQVDSSPAPTLPDAWERPAIRVRAQSKLATDLQRALTQREIPVGQEAWMLPLSPTSQMEQLAPGLRSCAQAEGKGIVAFERRDAAFGLGILARLDWGLEQAYSAALFETFLQASRTFALARQHNPAWEASRDAICTSVRDRVMQGQPLLSVPAANSGGKGTRAEHLSSTGQASPAQPLHLERLRTHAPTREELNKIRRQRLKVSPR